MLSTFRSTPSAVIARRRRRSLRLLAPAVAGAVLLSTAACGTSGPAGSSAGSLDVWALQDSALNPVQKQEISAFNSAQSGTKATMQTFVNDPYKQKLQTAIGSPQAPDVFLNWGGGNLATYVQAGDVTDLSSALAADPGWKSAFLPSVLAGGEIDGRYYGVPMEGVQPVSLFYNKSVFAKAGITTAPATWPQLLADVSALKAKGVIPIALGGSESWTELMWLEYLLDRIGGPSKFAAIAAGKPGAWQDPAVTTALTDIVQLIDAGGFGTEDAVAFLKTVTSADYIKNLIGIGQIPAVAGLGPQLAAGPNATFTTYVYGHVQNAPSFTQSWDQALSPAEAQTLLNNLQQVFNKQETPAQFVSALSGS